MLIVSKGDNVNEISNFIFREIKMLSADIFTKLRVKAQISRGIIIKLSSTSFIYNFILNSCHAE